MPVFWPARQLPETAGLGGIATATLVIRCDDLGDPISLGVAPGVDW